MPLAAEGVKYAGDVAKSIVAQVSDALRSPLLGSETTTTRQTRRGTKTTTTKAALPAWVAVAGGVMFLWWNAPRRESGASFGLFPGGVTNPYNLGVGLGEWLAGLGR